MSEKQGITFRLSGTDDDVSARSMTVTAHTPDAVYEVFNHYRLADSPDGVLAMAQAMTSGRPYSHEVSGKRDWFQVDVYLDDTAMAPYMALLARITGYTGPAPDLDLTGVYPHRLNYTHITDTIGIEDGMIHACVYIQAQDWNNRTASENADRDAADYVLASIGKRPHEREFIEGRNGHYYRNPNYAKWHRAKPGLGAEWLWSALFAWWRANHATPEQSRILDAVDALDSGKYGRAYDIRKGGADDAQLTGYTLYALDPSGTCDYDGKGKMARVYSWDEFRAAGAE